MSNGTIKNGSIKSLQPMFHICIKFKNISKIKRFLLIIYVIIIELE